MKRTNRNRITTLVITLLISAVAVVGCGNQSAANDSEVLDSAPANETALQKPSGDNFILKGKVSNGAGELIVLQKLEGGQLTFIDSVRADDKGKYKMKFVFSPFLFLFHQDLCNLVNIATVQRPERVIMGVGVRVRHFIIIYLS